MKTSLEEPQTAPFRVKNILIRQSSPKKVNPSSNYQHPETSYILKYAPKYYKSLTLQTTCQISLLSKVKKIKKLKTFTGYFNRPLPQNLWFNLLANTRKEIEEFPEISSNNAYLKLKTSFWTWLNQQKLRHFWNITNIWLPKGIGSNLIHNFLTSKKYFMKHVWNMRRLKSLKITVDDGNYIDIMWVLAKMDRMSGILGRLETLSLHARTYNKNVKELFQNKKFFSHLTSLDLSTKFDPIFAEIPQICKKLNSLALNFFGGAGEKPEYNAFLSSIQQLTHLKSLNFNSPAEGKNLWSYFKPQTSLEYLRLRLNGSNLVNAGFFKENSKDFFKHWKELKDLKVVEFSLSCTKLEEFNLIRIFVTNVLKKATKLETLKIFLGSSLMDNGLELMQEPFFVEEVSHLYWRLERFEYKFLSLMQGWLAKFDLELLQLFRSLRSLKLEGNLVEDCENLEGIVSLLEENHQYPVLEFKLNRSIDSPAGWLKNVLEIIERIKRVEKNLEIIIDLTFGVGGFMEILEELCQSIQSVRRIKGVKIYLNFEEEYNYTAFEKEKILGLLKSYPEIRNLNIVLVNGIERLEFTRMDGQKEQFF